MTIADVVGWALGALGVLLDCARTLSRDVQSRIEPVLSTFLPQPRARGAAAVREEAPASAAAPADEQAEVHEAKYYLASRAEPPRVERESGDLLSAYGRDRIVLLARDPWWLFAYWEVTPTTRVEALRALAGEAEGAREVLRVSDVTFVEFDGGNAWSWIDVETSPGAESWYVNVGKPATTYVAEIGLRTSGGRFVALARSNAATTPAAQPSPDTSVRWVTLHAPGALLEAAVGWSGSRIASETPPDLAAGAGRSSDLPVGR